MAMDGCTRIGSARRCSMISSTVPAWESSPAARTSPEATGATTRNVPMASVQTVAKRLHQDRAIFAHARRVTEEDYRAPLTSASRGDRKSTRLNSSHVKISYAVFCLKKKRKTQERER